MGRRKFGTATKKVMQHGEFIDRIRKTLYYGVDGNEESDMKISLPLAEIAADFFSEAHRGYSLKRLTNVTAGKIEATPCSLIMALIYLDRLNILDPGYARLITPQELFVVSLMISTKFYAGHDERFYLEDWAKEGNMTEDKLKEMELEFLTAIDWNIYISNEQFFEKLSSVERTLAEREGLRRGWLTYSELVQLLPSFTLMKFILNNVAVLALSYAASVITIAGAFFIASQVPGTLWYRRPPTNGVSTASTSPLSTAMPLPTPVTVPNATQASPVVELATGSSATSSGTAQNESCRALNVEGELLKLEEQYCTEARLNERQADNSPHQHRRRKANVSCSRLGELDAVAGSCAADGPVSCDSEVLMPPSVSTSNSQFPKLTNGIICCTLNTEDLEIPCNEDVVFPKQLCPLVQRDQRDPGQSHGSSQMKGSQMIPEMGQLHPVTNCKAKCKDSSCVAPKTGGLLANGSAQINSKNVSEGTIWPKLPKEKSEEIIPGKHLNHSLADSLIEKPALCSDSHNSYSLVNSFAIKQMDALEMFKDPQTSNPVGPMDIISPELVVDHQSPDLEELMIESDDDIPYFSDIEAMILDMDLDPDDQDLCDPEVARYRHEDTKRAIIRLEQASHSYMQRAISSNGAFAILYGRHSKHYIKKPEILLGRKTEDFVVDIDLGKEGCANKVSRRQAIISMKEDGSFHLQNLGKRSVSINGKEVAQGQSLRLNSGCLIEVRGTPFIFETNQTCVKQYLNGNFNSGAPC